jgi:DNA-binding NarL/FixJ family response regulator
MPTSSIRVLIADDHPIVRNGLVRMIELADGIEVVAEAETGTAAIDRYRQHQPDVALMDLRLPDMNGVDAIATIRQEFPNACIMILTTYDTDEDIFRGLQAGAKGYLLKNMKTAQLLDAIRTVAAGQNYIPLEVGAKLVDRMSQPQLTRREQEVLQLMSQGKTNHEIAEELFISESTVKFHVNHLLSKLGTGDRTQAVLMALKRGIANP